MRVAVPKETRPGEKRVALVPDIISKLTKAGLDVVIESGAGVAAEFSDAQFAAAGATVTAGDVTRDADVILSIQPLTPDGMKALKKGAIAPTFVSAALQELCGAATVTIDAETVHNGYLIQQAKSSTKTEVTFYKKRGTGETRGVVIKFPQAKRS